MSIQNPISTENERKGNGKYTPIRKLNGNDNEKSIFVSTDLMTTLNDIDHRSLRTTFKQATDPVYLAFQHVEKKPLTSLIKDFAKDSASDFFEIMGSIFVAA